MEAVLPAHATLLAALLNMPYRPFVVVVVL
jgi:hypothetical protein